MILNKNNIYRLTIIIFIFCVGSIYGSTEEGLTITTYFPAPYGSYRDLTTTGNTYLATDGSSNVGIGTTAPVPQGLLQVGDSSNPGLFVQKSVNGNIGMGTTTPLDYKLYVIGDLYIKGELSHPAGSVPPGVGAGACPAPCTLQLCKNGTCAGYGDAANICTIIILDGIITSYSNCE